MDDRHCVQIKEQVTIETRTEITLSKKDIIELIAGTGINIAATATVAFDVPGGGDWSNETIDIDDDHPIRVQWTTKTTKGNLDG